MTKKEVNKRPNFNPSIKQILVDEVDSLCPLCSDYLFEEKNGNQIIHYEVAHIYPLNPLENEKKILEDVEKLSLDINHINNLIALCKKCHKKYDTNKTVEEYEEILKIKKNLIKNRDSKINFKDYKIENEISEVFQILENDKFIENNKIKFNYNPKIIDEKLNKDFPISLKRYIKSDINTYYSVIKAKLIEIEKKYPSKSESIALEIKLFYLKLHSENKYNQTEIFEEIAKWLEKKTKTSNYVCKIIVSFFVQNCEIFE